LDELLEPGNDHPTVEKFPLFSNEVFNKRFSSVGAVVSSSAQLNRNIKRVNKKKNFFKRLDIS